MEPPSKRLRTDGDGGPDPSPPPTADLLQPVAKSTPTAIAAGNTLMTPQLDVDAVALLGSLRQSSTRPEASAAVLSAHTDTAPPPRPIRVDPAPAGQQQQQQQHALLDGEKNKALAPSSSEGQADAVVVADLIHECKARDSRCSRVIGHATLAGVHTLFEGSNHVMADVVGDGAKIATCPKRGVHAHIHSHFYSVADAKRSKRRLVPVFLFWKSRLGWDFPITDEIVELSRAHLSSCEFGFFPGNGHLKARPKLCIHPGHLHPSSSMNYGPLLMPLVGVVHALKLFKEDNNIAIELKELGWNDTQFNSVKAKNPTEIFEKLLNRIKVAWANRPPDPVFEITSDSPKNGAVTQGRSPASRRASGSSRKPSAGRGGGGGRRNTGRGRGNWKGRSAVAGSTAADSNSAALAASALQVWPGAQQADLAAALPMQQQQQFILLQQHQHLVALQQQVFVQQVLLQQAAAASVPPTALESATPTQLAGSSAQALAAAAATAAASGTLPGMLMPMMGGLVGSIGLGGSAAASAAAVGMGVPGLPGVPSGVASTSAAAAAAMMFQGMFPGVQQQHCLQQHQLQQQLQQQQLQQQQLHHRQHLLQLQQQYGTVSAASMIP